VARITILKDQETLAAAAADRVAALTRAAIESRDRMVICLAGGQTPRRLYQLLADAARPWRTSIDWSRVYVFWGDERPVPPDDGQSNFGMASRALLDHVPLAPDRIYRMRGELTDVEAAAREYQATIGSFEPFDAVLLGMGRDGHIASIFPGSPLLDLPATKAGERVAAVWVEPLRTWRITLTPQALLGGRAIVVLVAGAEKAEAVSAAIEGPEDVKRWPAQLLRRAGDRVEWLMDDAAARWLSERPA
jgi:6-phosphogluconolactonase